MYSRLSPLNLHVLVLKSRGNMDSDEGRDHLERTGLLLPEEWDALVDGERHTTGENLAGRDPPRERQRRV